MLSVTPPQIETIIAHCLDGLPEEACGLISGLPDGSGSISQIYPTSNAAASAKLYEVDSRDHLLADKDADSKGMQIIGVFHSHTHTDAYPSPTDIEQAPDPSWHYVLISLRHADPVIRSYRISAGKISEEPVIVRNPTST